RPERVLRPGRQRARPCRDRVRQVGRKRDPGSVLIRAGASAPHTPVAIVGQTSIEQVRSQIAGGATDPVYVLAGDDDHEKSALALAFGEMVEADLRAFNVERLYASDKVVTP